MRVTACAAAASCSLLVLLIKQASEHEQKVHETVRRTHVGVEQIGAKPSNRQ